MDQVTPLLGTFWKLSIAGRIKPKLLTLANKLCMISALTAPSTAPPPSTSQTLDLSLGAQMHQEIPSHLRPLSCICSCWKFSLAPIWLASLILYTLSRCRCLRETFPDHPLWSWLSPLPSYSLSHLLSQSIIIFIFSSLECQLCFAHHRIFIIGWINGLLLPRSRFLELLCEWFK